MAMLGNSAWVRAFRVSWSKSITSAADGFSGLAGLVATGKLLGGSIAGHSFLTSAPATDSFMREALSVCAAASALIGLSWRLKLYS